jgi:phospho-N-acetylmuramoyl-pentapeptide-transferase
MLAFVIALAVVLLMGPHAIRALAACCRESIRQDSARLAALSHAKAGTPTMGGLLILVGFLVSICLVADFSQPTVAAAMVLSLVLGALGMRDDLCKRTARRRGISARAKLVGQSLIALTIVGWLIAKSQIASDWLSATVSVLLIVGMSNAVNLADGLDGLASGCSLLALAAIGAMCSLAAPRDDLSMLSAALAGAVAGFLWFNRHPARVFMGDSGSLPLGGLLGLLMVLVGQHLAALLVCGVFLAEAASVILQVGWFRCTGRRVLLCAPLHHHFQFLGWSERRIVGRFWLAGVVCALVGLAATLLGSPPSPILARGSIPRVVPQHHP